MVFLIALTYFIIGYILSLLLYVYFCKDYQKHDIHTSWERYYERERVEGYVVFIIVLWPIALIILLSYCLFVFPFDYIRKRNGIK